MRMSVYAANYSRAWDDNSSKWHFKNYVVFRDHQRFTPLLFQRWTNGQNRQKQR